MTDITWNDLSLGQQVALEDLYADRSIGVAIEDNNLVKEASGSLLYNGLVSISKTGVVYLTTRGCDVYEHRNLNVSNGGTESDEFDPHKALSDAYTKFWQIGSAAGLSGFELADRISLPEMLVDDVADLRKVHQAALAVLACATFEEDQETLRIHNPAGMTKALRDLWSATAQVEWDAAANEVTP